MAEMTQKSEAEVPAAGEQDAPYLADLNPAQREAVAALDGPVLVLAGAGTGKTRVLTTRLAHLLRTGRAHPGQVLAVTFTNKAAQEMRDRVAGLLGRPVEGWWLGTFHALAARMLRLDAERAELSPRFTIIDTDDQLRLVKQLLSAEGIDDKKWPARGLLAAIQRWKDRGLTPDRVSASEAGDLAGGRAVELYGLYHHDVGYGEYHAKWRNRGTTIYVGANDGMLHAFKGGTYYRDDNPATIKHEHGWYSATEDPATSEAIGEERWAYIPYNLISNIKLPST